MNNFFSIFGKITLVVLILAAFVYGGYYLGKNNSIFNKPEAVSTEAGNAYEVDETVNEDTSSETPVTPEPKTRITIVAGLTKDKGLSFDQYSLMIPEDWNSKKEAQSQLDEKLVLTKGEYSINIFQAATGGALCLYPGDDEFEGPSSKFETFNSLTTKDNRQLRRSGDKNGLAFTVCQKSPDGSYQQPTSYGHISVKLPANYTNEVLTEIDSILSSLKKI